MGLKTVPTISTLPVLLLLSPIHCISRHLQHLQKQQKLRPCPCLMGLAGCLPSAGLRKISGMLFPVHQFPTLQILRFQERSLPESPAMYG